LFGFLAGEAQGLVLVGGAQGEHGAEGLVLGAPDVDDWAQVAKANSALGRQAGADNLQRTTLPVYDKPLVYYPLSALMLAGIRNVLVITTPEHVSAFVRLLGDGSRLGMNITYAEQPAPEGIAQAFLIGARFIADAAVALILGDNIFFGQGLSEALGKAARRQSGATVFAYSVRDPQRYGVVEFDEAGQAVSIEEKPVSPKSSYAITGLYFYDSDVVEVARSLRPSARGELEITDVNRAYLAAGKLHVEVLGRGIAWLDTGTYASLLQASNFIQTLQERQGLRVACLEEVAFKMGFIDGAAVTRLADRLGRGAYADYLRRMFEEDGA